MEKGLSLDDRAWDKGKGVFLARESAETGTSAARNGKKEGRENPTEGEGGA